MNIITGIYGIRSKVKFIYYIGQSLDIYSRWYEHKRVLMNGCHHSKKLQRHFNKYGLDDLEFIIIMQDIKLALHLDFWEKFFITCFDSWKGGFNCTQGGDGAAWRECTLQHIETGETITTPSIIEFAKRFALSRKRIGELLNGKKNFVGDWYNPKGRWQPQFKFIRDPEGNIHKFFFITRFARTHQLNCGSLCSTLSGKYQSTDGWTRVGGPTPRLGNYFKLVDPKGNLHEGRNLDEFARKINESLSINEHVNGHVLAGVQAGRKNSNKGWRKFINNQSLTPFKFRSTYKFISPNGEIVESNTLSNLARQFNINQYRLSYLWNNKINSYLGWKKYTLF